MNREAESLGLAIRGLRKLSGLQQRDLAARAGIDPTDLSRFENGRREPSLAQLKSIAKVLKVPASKLVKAYAAHVP